MNSKILIIAVAHLAVFQLVQSNCINRVLPFTETILPNSYFGPSVVDYPVELLPSQIYPTGPIISERILPNGQLYPNVLPGPILPNVLPSPVVMPNPVMPVLPNQLLAPVQDTTVANNLANTLQLLVVSNLLANRLPYNDVVVPSPVEILPSRGPCGYNVVY